MSEEPVTGTRAVEVSAAPEVVGEPDNVVRNAIPLVDLLPDEEFARLNAMLPWAAFVVDSHGRRFGRPYSDNKTTVAARIPDKRIVELDRRFPLASRRILELGCFEGIHTVALARAAASVVAVDGRIENVVKTAVRCAAFGCFPTVLWWDAEEPPPSVSLEADVAHHVGVLYHLTDPVTHMIELSPLVREAILLDTHIADEGASLEVYELHGARWWYREFRESGRENPFAGLMDHAKWLSLEDLVRLLHECGFEHVDVARDKVERNGRRVTIYAHR